MGYWLRLRLRRCSGLLCRIAQWLCFGLRSLSLILVQPRKSKEKRARKEAIAFPKLFHNTDSDTTTSRDHSKSRKYGLNRAETEKCVYSFNDAGYSEEQNRVFSTRVGQTYDLLWLLIKRLQTDLKQDEQDISETTRRRKDR